MLELDAGAHRGEAMGKLLGLARAGRTVRLRFTVLYAVLFLVSGVGLLALTNLLAGGQVAVTAPGQSPPAEQTSHAAAQELTHRLQTQLSALEAARSRQLATGSVSALAVMAVVSVGLGKVVAGRVL